MIEKIVTSNLEDFGYRELSMAGELLKAYAENPPENFEGFGDLKIYMNRSSGYVFLSFEDGGDTLMMNGDKLEFWFNCFVCGAEGFLEDFEIIENHPKSEWYKEEECREAVKEAKSKISKR